MKNLIKDIETARNRERDDVTLTDGRLIVGGKPIAKNAHVRRSGLGGGLSNLFERIKAHAKYNFEHKGPASKPKAPEGTNLRDMLAQVARELKKPVRWINRNYTILQNARPIVLAEGDSWFEYPTGETSDITFELGKFLPVFSVSKAGDEIQNYVKSDNLKVLKRMIQQNNISCVIVSGGGNDVIADGVTKMINPRTGQINEAERDRILDGVIKLHKKLYTELANTNPRIHYYTHGYVAPFPEPRGNWIGSKFPANTDMDKLHSAIASIIDHYYRKLDEVSQANEYFHVIDARQAIGHNTRNHWANEIHLEPGPLLQIARALKAKIHEDLG